MLLVAILATTHRRHSFNLHLHGTIVQQTIGTEPGSQRLTKSSINKSKCDAKGRLQFMQKATGIPTPTLGSIHAAHAQII